MTAVQQVYKGYGFTKRQVKLLEEQFQHPQYDNIAPKAPEVYVDEHSVEEIDIVTLLGEEDDIQLIVAKETE